ncbi:LOW QUALITY PROTEIN: insulin-like growth factor-binding protein-like 1 [Gymnogyps californianus]|uniref:LOW QUALITY PROTEIN: insulin-like growth factor-binding protein-like 1 n=1 Tax=Gymnogyps californianus TaxID=33616 RepID=UPI0021C6E9A6|nr:LOW QUALITY PROTEIN: insulin-like growth factor-binding protein-like 1 [Gymnogyps californianus]
MKSGGACSSSPAVPDRPTGSPARTIPVPAAALLLPLLLPPPAPAAGLEEQVLRARDACGCCALCLGSEGEPCGGRSAVGAPRCEPGLLCASWGGSGAGPEGSGVCVCKDAGAVCGTDGRTYSSLCALRLRHWVSFRGGARRLRKTHGGECQIAPVIVVSPKKIHNVTGAHVHLSCELKAVPTPVIAWRKVSESRKGVKLLEELPGDRANMAVQVCGGLSQHKGMGQGAGGIDRLMKEDEGFYQCHATKIAGEAHADGSITVLEQNKSKKETSLLAWDSPA